MSRKPNAPSDVELPRAVETPSPVPAAESAPLEHDLDRLVDAAGPIAEARIEHDPRFLDWQAAELRTRQRPRERLAEGRVNAIVGRVRAQALGARFDVRCVAAPPEAVAAPVAGVVEQVIDAASASGYAPRLDLGIAAGAGRALWDEPCDSWIAIPDDFPRGRYVALTVKGDSMLPLLHSEDVVLVKLGSDVARDAIVVARRPDDGYVVKRVGRVSGAAIELLSLNPDFAPTLIERAEGTVAGTVVLRWCRHGG